MRKYHVRFGGGWLEKEPQGHLASRLPNSTDDPAARVTRFSPSPILWISRQPQGDFMSTGEPQSFRIPMDDPIDEPEPGVTPEDGPVPPAEQPVGAPDAPAGNPAYTRRVFRYDSHTIPDPGPHIEIEDVRRALIPYFPDLVQATHTQRVEGDTLVVTFQKQATRKGADVRSAPRFDPLAAPLGWALRRLPRFRDALSALDLPPTLTFADLAEQREAILEALDADQLVPHLAQRMAAQCLTLPPSPLVTAIPFGF